MEDIKFKSSRSNTSITLTLEEIKTRARILKVKINNRRMFIKADHIAIRAFERSLKENTKELNDLIEDYTDLLNVLTNQEE